jgi:hypothetical protein
MVPGLPGWGAELRWVNHQSESDTDRLTDQQRDRHSGDATGRNPCRTRCRTPTGENFQYVFKGTPSARRAVRPWPGLWA